MQNRVAEIGTGCGFLLVFPRRIKPPGRGSAKSATKPWALPTSRDPARSHWSSPESYVHRGMRWTPGNLLTPAVTAALLRGCYLTLPAPIHCREAVAPDFGMTQCAAFGALGPAGHRLTSPGQVLAGTNSGHESFRVVDHGCGGIVDFSLTPVSVCIVGAS